MWLTRLENNSVRVDWQWSGWFVVPSWMFSLVIHGGLLAAFAFALRTTEPVGNPDGDERVVGLYFNHGTGDFGEPGGAGEGATTETPTVAGPALDADLRISDAPPVELSLPEMPSTRLGPGGAFPLQAGSLDTGAVIRSSGPPASGGNGRGGGGTTFFGQKAAGSRFVYVLDASGSMAEYNALNVAKAELLASLEQLDATQQFQIVFYSEKYYPMLDPEGRPQMFAATDTNRALAGQFIRAVQPLEGTRHLDALMRALDEEPDVIYFLTDAGAPILDASDLDKIKRRNQRRARIHAIEFGKHANLSRIDNNFLQKLARENGGGYAYRDITKFGKK